MSRSPGYDWDDARRALLIGGRMTLMDGGGPTGNWVLDACSKSTREVLLATAERRHLALGDPLIEPGAPIRRVYFPITGVMSVVSVMENGDHVEAMTVGNEGMVGVPVYLGTGSTQLKAYAQVPGDVWDVDAESFTESIAEDRHLRDVMGRYVHTLVVQISQSAACNAVHSVEQRTSRWLLMTQNRMRDADYPITQEVLAEMLGVRAATVSEKASGFQRAGLIRYQRGHLTILDREGLERLSCECYQVIRDEYERHLARNAADASTRR